MYIILASPCKSHVYKIQCVQTLFLDIDECERDEHNCHDDLSHCEDNNGSYTCVCPLGYEWNGLMCKGVSP